MSPYGTIGQPFWDGERVVEPEEQLDPQQLRCPACGHVGSIDTFDCAGVDIELPEYGIGPDDNDVFCPACGEDVPAVFVDEEADEQLDLDDEQSKCEACGQVCKPDEHGCCDGGCCLLCIDCLAEGQQCTRDKR